MPRNTRKRPAELEDSPNAEDIDVLESDDEEILDGEEDDSAESEGNEMYGGGDPAGSPSPLSKKGILLRSGKRKRRRSAGTSGLTPPESSKPKRARTTGRKSNRRPANGRSSMVENGNKEETPLPSSVAAVRPPRASTVGRVSLLANDPAALAAAQDPEQSLMQNDALPIAAPEDSNRRLFDMKPPSMPETVVPSAISKEKPIENAIPELATPQLATTYITNGSDYKSIGEENNFREEDVPVKRGRKALFLRVLFLIILASSWVFLWPLCVKLADHIVPLRELVVPDLAEIPNVDVAAVNYEVEVNAQGDLVYEIPEALVQSLDQLVQMTKHASKKKVSVERGHLTLKQSLEKLDGILEGKKTALQTLAQSKKSRRALAAAIDEPNIEAAIWKQARENAALLGHVILDASIVDLWSVQDLSDCPLDATDRMESLEDSSAQVEEDPDPPISLLALEEELVSIKGRLELSINSVKESPDAENAIRSWVKSQLESVLKGDSEAALTIAGFSQALKDQQSAKQEDNFEDHDSEILDAEAIEEIVADRLEIARSDRTGEYDHASLQNGSKVIVGGKRGTSKSLVDYLPLFNRMLHFTKLRFYGYGPEAALLPTYPLDALGQCWSFQQTPLKELLKQRKRLTDDGDDHKRGNFGTLTISLPTRVSVSSVVIEHPPRGLTDHIASAIRSFRVIGYEDAEASSKPWLLGSFEYDIKSTNPLQEFEVAKDIFDKQVPPMHSVTLAIDSNWGNDYACLYRFRVHGDEEGPAGDNGPVKR